MKMSLILTLMLWGCSPIARAAGSNEFGAARDYLFSGFVACNSTTNSYQHLFDLGDRSLRFFHAMPAEPGPYASGLYNTYLLCLGSYAALHTGFYATYRIGYHQLKRVRDMLWMYRAYATYKKRPSSERPTFQEHLDTVTTQQSQMSTIQDFDRHLSLEQAFFRACDLRHARAFLGLRYGTALYGVARTLSCWTQEQQEINSKSRSLTSLNTELDFVHTHLRTAPFRDAPPEITEYMAKLSALKLISQSS